MRVGLVLLAAVAAVGCYESHAASGGGATTDAAVPPPPPPPGSASYVIAQLAVPEASFGAAPGANLDGRDSRPGTVDPFASCEEARADYTSSFDGLPGVDNAFAPLVPTVNGVLPPDEPIDTRIRRALAGGEVLIGIVVRPGEVEVHLLAATGPLAIEGDMIAPNQRFTSLEVLGHSPSSGIGSITARFDRLALPLPTWIVPFLPFADLSRVEMRFSQEPGALARGELGASVSVDDAVAHAAIFAPGMEETVRAVLDTVADIDPVPGDPTLCASFSMGLSFEAVPAQIE